MHNGARTKLTYRKRFASAEPQTPRSRGVLILPEAQGGFNPLEAFPWMEILTMRKDQMQ